jgi:hypothetical protein
MPELPWVKWFPTNWASEPGLRLCEAATRGIWFEALNTMFLQKTGSITGTIEELAALLSCRTSQMQLAIEQLKMANVAKVIASGSSITIACRRCERQYEISELRRKSGAIGLAKRWQRSASASNVLFQGKKEYEEEGEPEPVKLTKDQAVAQALSAGVPEQYSAWLYEDWASRGGKDAAKVRVIWSSYAKKRWNREQDLFRAGLHDCQKKATSTNIASIPNLDEQIKNMAKAQAAKDAYDKNCKRDSRSTGGPG